MAIDSALKRRNVGGIPFPLSPGVTPDSDKDQVWRQSSGWSYSGILAGEAVPPPISALHFRGNTTVGSRRRFGGLWLDLVIFWIVLVGR